MGAYQEGLLVLKTPLGIQPLAQAPCFHPCIHPSAPESVGQTHQQLKELMHGVDPHSDPRLGADAVSYEGWARALCAIKYVVTSVYKPIISCTSIDLGRDFYLVKD